MERPPAPLGPGDDTRVVGAEAFEAALRGVAAATDDPRAGPWGPRSMMWRVSREKCVFLAAGKAALLQLAHPYVGEAIAASESAVRDPILRFRRTFEAVYAMVFGTLDDALGAARTVHRVHRHVEGELPAAGRYAAGHRYRANEVAALEWVLATLVDGSVHAFELTVGSPSPAQLEAFWRDARTLGQLMGLTELPPDWAAFERYRDAALASDMLAVTPRAADVGRALLVAPDRVTAPVWATYRAITAHLLPARFRAPFGLRYGRRERAVALAALAAARAGYLRVPARIRWVPAYHEARWRLSGAPARDRVGRGSSPRR
ncbi:MAG: oxygenase MpaB family protein [Myxococcota bacterium]